MATQTEKPLIFLVCGSWHTPKVWYLLEPFLNDAGYETVKTSLMSNGSKASVPNVFAHDAKKLTDEITALVEQGKEIVMVMHSYGGLPGSEACKGNTKSVRQKEGKKGGVIACVYLCSFMIPTGYSLMESAISDPGELAFIIDVSRSIQALMSYGKH
jgi:hypothetical protein